MTAFERQSSLAALALRLIIAGFFGYHFFFKLQAGFAANVTSFEMRAFPLPTLFAFVDMFVEACVIPFLVLGIYSRFCMIMLIPLMLGIWGVFWPRAFNFSMGGSELPTRCRVWEAVRRESILRTSIVQPCARLPAEVLQVRAS